MFEQTTVDLHLVLVTLRQVRLAKSFQSVDDSTPEVNGRHTRACASAPTRKVED